MTFSIDLHAHTYYSDGRASPEELIRYAVKIGVKTLAITDHDNTRGTREGADTAQRLGIELIPAVEFTARWDELPEQTGDVNIDILGYFIDAGNAGLRAFEQEGLDDVHAFMTDACRRMTEAGYPIGMEEVFAINPRYGGAMFLIDAAVKKGHAKDWRSGVALVDPFLTGRAVTNHSIAQVIAAIYSAGGTAVLAHPVLVRSRNAWLNDEWMGRLVDMGLQGIEVFHMRQDEAARRYFLRMAHRFGLAVTGGSDDHGWPAGFPRLGMQPVTQEMVAKLRRVALGQRGIPD